MKSPSASFPMIGFDVVRHIQSGLIYIFIVIVLPYCAQAADIDEAWLFERYRSGDIDTIRVLLDAIPDSSDAGQFFRGVFEKDGEAARFYYDRALTLWPGGLAEPWSLERLWQYHYARGDGEQAERFYTFLKERHPEHPGLDYHPDFSCESSLIESKTDHGLAKEPAAASPELFWTVQMGAFGRPEGAREVQRKVERFGEVKLVRKVVGGVELTVVTIGRFKRHAEAERLVGEIKTSTGIQGWVIPFEE